MNIKHILLTGAAAALLGIGALACGGMSDREAAAEAAHWASKARRLAHETVGNLTESTRDQWCAVAISHLGRQAKDAYQNGMAEDDVRRVLSQADIATACRHPVGWEPWSAADRQPTPTLLPTSTPWWTRSPKPTAAAAPDYCRDVYDTLAVRGPATIGEAAFCVQHNMGFSYGLDLGLGYTHQEACDEALTVGMLTAAGEPVLDPDAAAFAIEDALIQLDCR